MYVLYMKVIDLTGSMEFLLLLSGDGNLLGSKVSRSIRIAIDIFLQSTTLLFQSAFFNSSCASKFDTTFVNETIQ